MFVESRDSNTLKPVELDELGQLGLEAGLIPDSSIIDLQVEHFPLVVLASIDEELVGYLFGSLERIGGTPSILWSLGCQRKVARQHDVIGAMTGELFRRAAISFPDEDVLVAGRVAHPAAYTLFGQLDDVCPRPKYAPNGEERAWGRRLARRFGCDARYDDRSFRLSGHGSPELVLHAAAVKAGGKVVVELVGETDPANGEALIAYGWAMAEALADGLATTRS